MNDLEILVSLVKTSFRRPRSYTSPSQPSGEVIAVGLQASQSQQEVIITIVASNETVEDHTINQVRTIGATAHLQSIWNLHRKAQRSDPSISVEELAKMEGPEFPSPKVGLKRLSDDQKSNIMNPLMASPSKMTKPPDKMPQNLPRILKRAAGALDYISGVVWTFFVSAMQCIQELVNKVVLPDSLLDSFVSGEAITGFPLLGYLKKVISLQNNIDQLVFCGVSPRMRRLLSGKELKLVGLGNPVQQLPLPVVRAWVLSVRCLHVAQLRTELVQGMTEFEHGWHIHKTAVMGSRMLERTSTTEFIANQYNLGQEFAREITILNRQLNDPLNHLGRFELTRSNQLEAITAGQRSFEDEEIVNLAILNSCRSFYAKGNLFLRITLEPLFTKEPAISSSWKATRHSCQAEFGSDRYEARTDGISQHQNTGNIQAVVEANRKIESMK
ncbi:hypothetical protein V8E54_008692 [Elaphomyces granulatus]